MCLSEVLLGVVAPRSGCLCACVCMCLSELVLGSMLKHNLYLCMCTMLYTRFKAASEQNIHGKELIFMVATALL